MDLPILADESVGRPIIERLRQEGYSVEAIEEIAPGSNDTLVLDRAVKEHALLLTEDKDFGDLVYRNHLPIGAGIVLLRLAGLTTDEKCDCIVDVLAHHMKELEGAFTVVMPQSIRVRPIA